MKWNVDFAQVSFRKLVPVILGVLGLGVLSDHALAAEPPVITAVGLTDARRGTESTFYILGKHFSPVNVRVNIFDPREARISVWENKTLKARFINANTIEVKATLKYTPESQFLTYPQRFDGVLHVAVSCADLANPTKQLYSKPFKQHHVHYFPEYVAPPPPAVPPGGFSATSPLSSPDSRPTLATLFLVVDAVNSDSGGPDGQTLGYPFTFTLKASDGSAIFTPAASTYVDPDSGVVDTVSTNGVQWYVWSSTVSSDMTTLTIQANPSSTSGAPPAASGKLIFNVEINNPRKRQRLKTDPAQLWDFVYNQPAPPAPPGNINPTKKPDSKKD